MSGILMEERLMQKKREVNSSVICVGAVAVLNAENEKCVRARNGITGKWKKTTCKSSTNGIPHGMNSRHCFIVGATKLTHESQRGTFPGGDEISHT